MPIKKTIVILLSLILVFTSFLSGCILRDLLFGTRFEIKNWDVDDYEGFPVLNLFFSASNKVTLKTYDTNSEFLDTDFFYSDGDTTLNIGGYRENIAPGTYKLQVYNADNKVISDEKFKFTGPDLSIVSCTQRWWENKDVYYLLGLEITLLNEGDTPFYPHSVRMLSSSEIIADMILPDVVLPGSTKTVYCYVYHRNTFNSGSFILEILDENNNVMATGSFSFNVEKNVEDIYYQIDALHDILTIPYIDFLFEYYSSLDRIYLDDYSVFVFDRYDESYLDLLLEFIISTYRFGETGFNLKSDLEKVEYIASFAQGIEYKPDSEVDETYEYPRYPVETLFNGPSGGGDCEDKSILTVSLLKKLGYETALFRLPKHMAVGVKLDEDAIPVDYYVDDYYFLETTSPGHKCGYVSQEEYKNLDNLTVYPITDRPLLSHKWKSGIVTTYTSTRDGDIVKAISYTKNLGIGTAENVVVEGVFFIEDTNIEYNSEQVVIPELKPGEVKKTIIVCMVPESVTTRFQTRIYLDGEIVDYAKSKNYFS